MLPKGYDIKDMTNEDIENRIKIVFQSLKTITGLNLTLDDILHEDWNAVRLDGKALILETNSKDFLVLMEGALYLCSQTLNNALANTTRGHIST